MGMRRTARHHDTVAVRRQAVVSEDYAEHRQGDRVITIDGPGRVVAVHDGPYPGSEEYEIRLEGGLGGGTYDAGQITASAPVEASVGQSEAAGIHLASDDYEELGDLLFTRPDPASLTYTASLDPAFAPQDGTDGLSGDAVLFSEAALLPPGSGAGLSDGTDLIGSELQSTALGEAPGLGTDTTSTLFSVAHVVADRPQYQVCREVHAGVDITRVAHVHRAGVSDEMPVGPAVSLHHAWAEGSGIGAIPEAAVAQAGRGSRPEPAICIACAVDLAPETVLDRLPGATASDLVSAADHVCSLASHWYPELGTLLHDRPDPATMRYTATLEYQDGPDGGLSLTPAAPGVEDDEGQVMRDMGEYHSDPLGVDSRLARSINGEEIDDHGSAPGWHRAANPNEYDRQSTEGEPDPAWIEDARERQQAMASSLPSITAETGPADLGRELDKFRDDQAERHQDDARFATNWEPLHKSSLKPEEHDGWMFMEHRSQPMLLGHEDAFNKNTLHVDVDPTPMELTTYKHGITRKPLYLDSEGKSWQSLGMIEKGGQRHEVIDRFPGSATNHLRRSGHYDDLEQMGAAPETKYNTDYQLQRNKRLNDAGFDVVSHKIVGPSPEDPAEIAKHLVEQHGYTHDQLHNLGESGQGDELAAEHELEHNASTYEDGVGGGEFGNGEQGGGVEHKHGPAYEEFSTIPHLEHPIWGGAYNPEPGAAENAVTESMPAGVHPDDVPRHPWALSMLVTAAQDPSFRFHVTAAWRDVQAKAKRIRSQGGVSIKHSDGMTVVADVKGDHNVYETALQRAPGRRQSVAVYACGCKWGAYHWGASDDLSRFAGRMCSHALALQYEAASRGMFGRDVEVDDARPRWVPSKVVVKYDIDTGQHIRATASVVPEQPPILVALASMRDGDPAAHVITAAVNDMFGDTSGYTEPSLMNPMGPTAPWNPDESPASAGPLSGGEPYNWGRINGPTMLPRIASVITTEAFWQAIVPLVRAVAPKVIKSVAPKVITHEVKKHQQKPVQEAQVPDGTEYGSQATLNDEPEGALPETDGDDHTASLGDVDIVNDDISTLGDDALSPESPSIQTQGGTADIVAAFQRSAAAQALMAGAPAGDTSSADIAQAAQAYLAKTAASAFTRAEQDELINESPGVQASNTDRLDIAGTHYAELDARDEEGDDLLWMM